MSYVALYRKFRPKTFSQVKGQDHIVRTLKNQIKNNRIGHAYLFTGTRGTGKTSVAKILAKAVNCLSPIDGEPCGECENCLAANQGTFMDIVEIDAASNTGVEDIRRVIEEIQYTPAKGRYKVYIIDEVHMLSVNAFNAFLKTLEEPPEYVVFVLATTEPHKLPATILSRCQRYDFKRIDLDTIAGNLKELLDAEGVSAEEKAIRYVARAGDGSMRDALSLMDRCVAFYAGDTITYEGVLSVLGTVDTEAYSALYRAIDRHDAAGALAVIEKTVESGKDLTPFISDFILYIRNILVLNVGGKQGSELLGLSAENLKVLTEDAKGADCEALMRDIRILSELLNQIRFSPAKQILTEVAVIRLARPQMETGMDALLERVRALEQRSVSYAAAPAQSGGDFTAAPAPMRSMDTFETAPQSTIAFEPEPVMPEPDIIDIAQDEYVYQYEPEPEPEEEPDLPGQQTLFGEPAAVNNTAYTAQDAGGGAASLVKANWQAVLNACDDRRLKVFLSKTQTEVEEGDSLAIYTNGDIAYKQLKEASAQEYLKQLITNVCGVSPALYVKHMDSKPEIPEQQDFGSLFKNINMNIETEEI